MVDSKLIAVPLALMSLLVQPGPARADDPPLVPVLYGRTDQIGATGVSAEAETAVGTRDARPFVEDGVEQRVRVRFGYRRVGVELHAGIVLGQDRQAGGADVHLDASPAASRVRIGLVAGWERDYRGADVVHARALIGATIGRTSVGAMAVAEVPFAEGRDRVDLVVGVSAGRAITRRFSVGAELVGEDLEGFVVPDEAEGGARLVAGPTAAWRVGDLELRLLAGATVVAGAGTGGVGRLAVGARF